MKIPSRYISLFALPVVIGLAGCNTVSGAGKDLSDLGNLISGGAEDAEEAVFGPSGTSGSPGTMSRNEAPETQTGMTGSSQTQSNGQTGMSTTGSLGSTTTSSGTSMSSTTSTEPISGQSVVYFDAGSASLSQSSRNEIREALAQQQFGPQTRIRVTGYADSVGSSDANEQLAQHRAEAVAQELAMLGVPRQTLEVSWYGETQLAVATGDDVPEAENRRVIIQYMSNVAQTY